MPENRSSFDGLTDFHPPVEHATFNLPWGSEVRFNAATINGAVPAGWRITLFHGDWPGGEMCHADSGFDCMILWMH